MHFTAKAQGRKSYAEEPTAQVNVPKLLSDEINRPSFMIAGKIMNGEFHKEMSFSALCLRNSVG